MALEIDPNFWMARANRGRALMHYAGALNNEGQSSVMAMHAHQSLSEAVTQISEFPHYGEPQLAEILATFAKQIEDHFDLAAGWKSYDPNGQDLGEEPEERVYRR